VILGTLVPIAAIAIAVVLIMTQKAAKSGAAAGRSIAAFDACLRAKVEASPGQSPSPTALQQEAEACGNHLPPGTRVPDFTRSQGPPASEQQAYDQCMQAALGNVQRGPGRAFNRQAFENASAMCRALIVGGGSSAPGTPATTASSSPTA
jgi:hypothetical protein